MIKIKVGFRDPAVCIAKREVSHDKLKVQYQRWMPENIGSRVCSRNVIPTMAHFLSYLNDSTVFRESISFSAGFNFVDLDFRNNKIDEVNLGMVDDGPLFEFGGYFGLKKGECDQKDIPQKILAELKRMRSNERILEQIFYIFR